MSENNVGRLHRIYLCLVFTALGAGVLGGMFLGQSQLEPEILACSERLVEVETAAKRTAFETAGCTEARALCEKDLGFYRDHSEAIVDDCRKRLDPLGIFYDPPSIKK